MMIVRCRVGDVGEWVRPLLDGFVDERLTLSYRPDMVPVD